MKKVKIVLRFIVEIILTVSIVAFISLYTISSKIFSEKYVLSSLEKANYYDEVHKLLESNFEKYIGQSGLDENTLKDIVTKEDIKKDTEKIITSIFDGLKEDISTKELKNRLHDKIKKSVNKNNLSTVDENAINEFINQICNEYKSTISSLNYESQINDIYSSLMKYIKIAKKVTIVSIGISIILLILLNLKRMYRVLTNLGISILASGLILTILNIYFSTSIKIDYISILNDQISGVLRSILKDILGVILFNGILLIIVGLVFIIGANIISNLIKFKKMQKKEMYEQ